MNIDFLQSDFWQSDSVWIAQIFAVVFVALLADFIQRRILHSLAKRGVEKTRNLWDDALLEAIRQPLSLLIWVMGISSAAQIATTQAEAEIFTIIESMRDVLVIVALTWFLVRFIRQAEGNIIAARKGKGEQVDVTTLDAITKLLRLSVIITAGLVVLQTLGFSISGVLAFGGVGGIAVGFAARDLLANFFGGLMLYLDRPFSVGDWVRSPDREIEGTVEHIGWRLTMIRTFDKRPLYVPNSVFANIAVENPSRMTNRRIYETFGIRYGDLGKMPAITADVENMLKNHPAIDATQTLMVNFVSCTPWSVDFFVYTFTKTTVWVEFHAIKQDVLLKIADIVEQHGAEMAFPTSTVHVPDGIVLSNVPAMNIEPG
ncbi:Small-conductance mechanosensitive channel [hydrothermal vent metagenome]|uniref:Small-conductance mechanosensitive channel n=1 Tax=hydrothermal vent metagenome TaxID=652676 RepID=A0A3B0Z3C4_9ZZZZ